MLPPVAPACGLNWIACKLRCVEFRLTRRACSSFAGLVWPDRTAVTGLLWPGWSIARAPPVCVLASLLDRRRRQDKRRLSIHLRCTIGLGPAVTFHVKRSVWGSPNA